MARPKKKIDQNIFENLCEIQCTQAEICGVLNVDDKTLTRWCKDTYGQSFSETFNQKRQGGKASLRRSQWLTAEEGNPTMQIWLGKQYLGQYDKSKVEKEKIEADTEFVKTRTEALKGFDKDTSFLNELIQTVKGND